MGRKSLKETRQKEILKAFYSIAKKEGLENTSIAKVAKHMDINPSLIIHYFSTKEDLLISLNDYILEKYLALYSSNAGSIESKEDLMEIIDKLFSRKWNRLFDDSVFYSFYAQTYQSSRLKEKFKNLHDTLHLKFEEALLQANTKGIIAVDNIKVTALQIFSLIDGAYYYLGLVSDKNEYEEKVAVYKQLVMEKLNL